MRCCPCASAPTGGGWRRAATTARCDCGCSCNKSERALYTSWSGARGGAALWGTCPPSRAHALAPARLFLPLVSSRPASILVQGHAESPVRCSCSPRTARTRAGRCMTASRPCRSPCTVGTPRLHRAGLLIEIMTKKMSAMLLLRLVSGGPVEDTSSFRYTPTSLRILVHFSGHYGALSNTCARAAARRPASLAPWAQK